LAEAPVGPLNGIEPLDCRPHRGVVDRHAAGRQRRQNGARSVDVVDPPAAEPGTVLLLLTEQPIKPALDCLLVAWFRRERLERMGGHVGARLVGDLAEVAEGQLVEPESLVVYIERAPAPATRLHPRGPREATVGGIGAEV